MHHLCSHRTHSCHLQKKKKAKQLQQTVTKERNKVRLNKELFAKAQ